MKSKDCFADVICKIRKTNKLTQKQFADRLGLNQATISAWELSKQYPNKSDFKTLEKIAKEFDVDFDFLKDNLDISLDYRMPSVSLSEIRINDPYIVPIVERLELIYSKIVTENKYKIMLNLMNNLESLAKEYVSPITEEK